MLRGLLGGLALSVIFASHALAVERVALVIGNSAYAHLPSPGSAVADATLVGSALRSARFEVANLTNATTAQLRDAFASLGKRAGKDAILLVYYAGQGIQVGGENYMIPVDAKPSPNHDLAAMPVGAALETMERGQGSALILVLDAPRQASLQGSGEAVHPVYHGPRRSQEAENALLAFSTSPGATLFDHDAENGPYALAFSNALGTPGLSVMDLFQGVRLQVDETTGGKQRTWEQSSLRTDIVLNGN